MALRTRPTQPLSPLEARMNAAVERANQLPGAAAPGPAHATQTQVETKVQTQTRVQEEVEEEIQVADKTAIELKIKENPFFQNFEENAEATQEEKIMALANALDPKQHSMEELNKNYQLFQEYYTYIQSEELEQVLENVSRAIKELQGRSQIEITGILKNLRGMLNDVAVARDLVEVLRKARISGQTVKELSEAYDRNEQIVGQLRGLEGGTTEDGVVVEGKRKAAETEAAAAKALVDKAIAERDEKEATIGFKLRSILSRDTTYSDRVTRAEAMAATKTKALEDVDQQIATLKTQRDEEFEKEPLKILRSLDVANDNLSERLISMGHKGISTVQGAQKSVLQLIARANFSETEVDNIGKRIAGRQINLSNIRSGLAIASKSTDEFKQGLEEKGSVAEAALAAAKAPETGEPDILEAAKREDEALRLKNSAGDVITYQRRLNGTIAEMNGTVSKNIERSQETDRQKEIVQGTKGSITTLGRDTLTTVAGNLESVLHNLIADQTDETQNTVAAFGRAADELRAGALDRQLQRSDDQSKRHVELLDDNIRRLQLTTEAIAKAVEASVTQSATIAEREQAMAAATADLDLAATTMRKVGGQASDNMVRGPVRPSGAPEVAEGETPTP